PPLPPGGRTVVLRESAQPTPFRFRLPADPAVPSGAGAARAPGPDQVDHGVPCDALSGDRHELVPAAPEDEGVGPVDHGVAGAGWRARRSGGTDAGSGPRLPGMRVSDRSITESRDSCISDQMCGMWRSMNSRFAPMSPAWETSGS